MDKKILITGGGTAGHIYPAVAIIEYLKENYPDVKILFIGSKKGMEAKVIPFLSVNFQTIRASGFSITHNIFKKIAVFARFTLNLFSGFFSSLNIIRKFKPDFILGMGGYVCGPVLLASVFLRKKIGLHEQNFIPGRLNRFFAKFSKYIFLSFIDSKDYLMSVVKNNNSRLIFSGNPVRKSIKNFESLKPQYDKWQLEANRFTIVSFGGSLGAEKLNNSVTGLYNYLRNDDRIQILLISGERFYKALNDRLLHMRKSGDRIIFKLFSFIKDMEHVYRIADLIISRAGATTIAELIATKIPAILVPYPDAVENHQFYNAKYLEGSGKAIIVSDDIICAEELFNQIKKLFADSFKSYIQMKEKKIEMENINASEIISGTILNLMQPKN